MNLNEAYEICLKKFDKHMENFKLGSYVATSDTQKGEYYVENPNFMEFFYYSQWIASLFTGLAPLYYRTEKDSKYLIWANQYKEEYLKKVTDYAMENMHDIGFLYQPYSVALYQLTGDESHKEAALLAADVLVKRFCINGRYIDAWNRMDTDEGDGRAIIDTMMNVQLLLWAWKETGHRTYRDVVKAHVDTTIKYFIREDNSVAHSFLFDRATGEFLREDNNCGYGNGSHWARGTAWAMYGFAMVAKYLDDKKYYDIAVKITEKYLEEIGDEYVPIWDFRLPEDQPALMNTGRVLDGYDPTLPENKKFAKDTSAAAVAACALIELNEYIPNEKYRKFAEESVKELCKEENFYSDPNISGLLKRQNGGNITTGYGDYFFAEALQRVLNPGIETCWISKK